ncbi:hypothetical protein T03_13939 [Trichinella britovi]|uniref:Uncharacterized protein n=1 Tax=Trichinella britovi TaxID=45882 RepID=A0A0V1D8L2_TRIBR|nr:hypothetical protein T03_13939 [Trichinella britovi]
MLLSEAAGNYTLLLMTSHHFWHCLASIFQKDLTNVITWSELLIMAAYLKKDRLNTKVRSSTIEAYRVRRSQAASRLAAIIDHWLLFT